MLESIKLNGNQICAGPPAQKTVTTSTMTNTFNNPRSGASYNTKPQTTKKITLVDTVSETLHSQQRRSIEIQF